MRKYRQGLLIGVVIVAMLFIAYYWDQLGAQSSTSLLTSPGNESRQTESVPLAEGPVKASNSDSIAKTEVLPDKDTATPDEADQITGRTDSQQQNQLENVQVPGSHENLPNHEVQTSIALEYHCTLSVRCDTVLNNLNKLTEQKKGLIPEDGIIFAASSVAFTPGESVGDILQRELKKNKIHFEFNRVPAYESMYIEGINNLYEFDCGPLSGWQYQINGEFPSFSCSNYHPLDGDNIQIIYTCDLGKDIGGYNQLQN